MTRAILLLVSLLFTLLAFTDAQSEECEPAGADCTLANGETGICKERPNCAEGEVCNLICKRTVETTIGSFVEEMKANFIKKCGDGIADGEECTRGNGNTGVCEEECDEDDCKLVCKTENSNGKNAAKAKRKGKQHKKGKGKKKTEGKGRKKTEGKRK